MDRRDFITSTAALGALPLAAQAQARPKDVLIVANEFGPNSLDIHTVGANRASYGVSWLVYDRLMTYGKQARCPTAASPTTATSSNPSWPKAGRWRRTATR